MTRNPLVRHLPPGAPGLTEDPGLDENLARLAQVHLARATFARRRVSEAQPRCDQLRSLGKAFRSMESGAP